MTVARMHHQRRVARAHCKPRYTRQRPIRRGGAAPPCADALPPPTIASFTPTLVAAGSGATTFTVTGTNIVDPISVDYIGTDNAQGTVPGTRVSATEFTFTLPAQAVAISGLAAWFCTVGGVELDLGDNNLITVE